jgi:hypothetical protein
MTRVFPNIFSNGFYATMRRARDGRDTAFVPTLKVIARDFRRCGQQGRGIQRWSRSWPALRAQAGHRPANYSGHSMRSGYVTSAVEMNAPLLKIAE